MPSARPRQQARILSRSLHRVDRNRLAGWGRMIGCCGLAFCCVAASHAQNSSIAGAETSPPVKQQAQMNMDPGARSYAKNCAICHSEEREGILPGFPPLVGIKRRMNDEQLARLI